MSFLPQRDRKTMFASGGRTKQSFKKECDINQIMKKYLKTGELSPTAIRKRQAVFSDVSETGTFQEGMEHIEAANSAFYTLPAAMRTRFNNNPGELLDFCADPENKDEAIELGIIPTPEQIKDLPPEPAPEPTTKPVVEPKP